MPSIDPVADPPPAGTATLPGRSSSAVAHSLSRAPSWVVQAPPTRTRRWTSSQPEAVLSVDGAPFKGDKNAKLTLVDFTDYQ